MRSQESNASWAPLTWAHACGAAAFVYESCRGVGTKPYPAATHEQILELHLILFDELFRLAVESPVRWTR